jgi:hypothetical protein
MTRTRKGLVVGLCAFCVAGVASAAPERPAAKRASLYVMEMRPLAVKGSGFKPFERVRVRYSAAGATQTRSKVATRMGTFLVRFATPLVECRNYTLQAIGAKGTRTFLLAPKGLPDCKPYGAPLLGDYDPNPRPTN